jgi:HAE1 family hydrophobic/amphiphilic exporter-1
MELQVNFDSTRFIEQSVHEMNTHLILAVILTSLVCWIFLGSWSATFNVLLSIPTSIMGAFVGLYFFGFTLNTFTLLGLTLAIGIVVDDAIMVLENIFRYHEQKEGQIESAILGSREIAFAAMSASVAVIAIFLPVAFMKGVIGKFFLQFGVTISLAVFLSLIESLTITPMRSASFVHIGERTTKIGRLFESLMESLRVTYDKSLRWTLKYKGIVLTCSVVFFVGSFFLTKFVNKEFTPMQDMSLFLVRLQLPVGTSLSYTDEQAAKAEAWFRSRQEVKQVYAAIGGFTGGADSNIAILFVTMKDKGQRGKDPTRGRELSQQEFMDVARPELAKIPDVKPFMQDLSARGFSSGRGFPIEFTVQGPDWDQLYAESKKMMDEMEKSGMMTDIDTDYLLGMPEVQITPDRQRAAQHGISVAAIGNTVNAMIGGVRVGQFPEGGHRYDIRVQLPTNVSDVDNVKKILVGNARNNLIPLERVVNVEVKPSLQKISRVNRQRAITVTANMKPGVSQQTAMQFIQKKGKEILAPGYFLNSQGSSAGFQEAFQSLIFALIMGLAVAYMVLASQFNSFLDPVAILMALPFSISGALFALMVTGQSLNIYSFIGVLLLMGIVKKNSILLIEFTNTVRDRNGEEDPVKALVEACPIRLRPIVMTSMATMAAAVPSALALGAGAEAYRPMAITIIGGVLVSTVLTLYVVPCVYGVLDRFRKRDASRVKVKEAFRIVGNRNLEVD